MIEGESYWRSTLDIDPLDDGGEVSVIRNAEAKCKLGESPLWCGKTNRLYWIDISGKKLFCAQYTEKILERWNLEQMCPELGRPCCLSLCKSSRLLIAFESSFAFFDPENHKIDIAELTVQEGGEWRQILLRQEGFAVRLNDGRVNKNGTLLIGGINETWGDFKDEWKAVQPCYCVEKGLNTDGSPALLVSINEDIPLAKITNSICFSRDGSAMYHADTPTNEIRVFSTESNATPGGDVVIRTENGPDGSVIDARGGLWNAEYEGGVVHRYEVSTPCVDRNDQGVNGIVADSSFTPVLSFHTPAKQTTCPCIGGPAGDILFVTTASNFFSEERYIKEPLAGHVFMCKLPSSDYYIAENLFDDVP